MNIACIDVGTSRSKAAVYDENLRQSAFVDAPTRRIFPDGTIALDSLTADVVDLVQRLPEMERRSVDVLVFTTVFGHVFLNRQGESVGPGLAWNYRCCENAVREAEDYVSRSGEFVGRPMSPELLAPRLLAMRSAEPERLRQIVRVFGIKDYLIREFTGVSTTDYSQVDYAAFTESLREELAVGSLLPAAGPAHCIAAYLKADIARRTGLRTGLPVVLGSSDGTSAMYGAGVLACGQIATVCGSTDVAMATISDREISPNRLKKHKLSMNRAMIDGYALVGGSTGASGMISTWWRKRIGATSDRIWEDVLPGAEGISVVPSFGVERAPFYKEYS